MPLSALRLRFSTREIFLGTALIALVLALFVQQHQLRDTTRSLARYEKQRISAMLSPGTFRVIQTVADKRSDGLILVYRIEAAEFAEIELLETEGKRMRMLGVANVEPETGLHAAELVVFIDHVGDRRLRISTLRSLGHGGTLHSKGEWPSDGRSPLPLDFVYSNVQGVYEIGEQVELYRHDAVPWYIHLKMPSSQSGSPGTWLRHP